MTSRLKRKLNDLGVDTSSSKATENFCLIGTPLPPLEKSRDTGEFVPLWKQEVRDEKGRRRLHGAFTGGFSAGYFNSVGSKEGWAPSEFKSSRADRAKKKAARPEDFMDEEDLAELRDNQKLVDTTEEMDLDFWDRKKTSGDGNEKDSIVSVLEAALLPTPRDSVGAQILKKMGWRIGHGIGPKITYEQRKRQDTLSHAPAGSGGELLGVEDHEEARKHLYPPRDTKVPLFKRKDNKHGLGYEPGLGLSELVTAEKSAKDGSTPKQALNISAGFGLGALNEADEDDLDIYDPGLTQTGRRLAYDADEDDEQIMMANRSRPLRRSSQISIVPLDNVSRTTFSNGLPCVPDFVVATKPMIEENLFPPPIVPEGWAPNPRRVWEQDKENFNSDVPALDDANVIPDKNSQIWQARMTAIQRGNLLGETPLPTTIRSVFDYLKPKDRERLANLAASHAQLSTPTSEESEREPGPTVLEQEPRIPRLDAQIAKLALQGFQPFTNDPVKQTRYTEYLKAQAAGEDTVPFSRMPGQATDAFTRELQDYARSAQIFKPVSGAMAGRFTRAAVVDAGAKAVEGLHHPAEEGLYVSTPGEDGNAEEPKKEESPKENAARLGMFGPLTREVKAWVPARLLCKRFGVKEPEVALPSEAEASATSSKTDTWQSGGVLAITDGAEAGLAGLTSIGENEPSKSSVTGGKRDIANVGFGDEDETQGQDILTYERPGMDIFKAIFASDDEDDEEDDQAAGEDDENRKLNGTSQNDGDLPTTGIAETSKSVAAPSSTNRTLPPVEPVDYNNAAGKVDITNFKPTFVPRSDRPKKEKEKLHKGAEKDREKKRKKSKAALVSFEVDEDGGDVRREVEKKRKKSEKKAVVAPLDDEGEGMWVEKPPPETVQNFVPPAAISAPNTVDGSAAEERLETGPPRGRKRAIDFM